MSAPVKTPATRRNDPVTSSMAEDRINASGERLRQQHIVESVVWRYPYRTAAELAKLCSLGRYQVSRRLSEVETGQRIKRGPRRKCEVLGSPTLTWEPV